MFAVLAAALIAPASTDDLIAALGSPDFAAREHAEDVLSRRLESTGLVAAAVESPSPEVSRRASRVLAVHRSLRAATVVAELDRETVAWPYLDSLWWNPSCRGYQPDSLAGALVRPDLGRYLAAAGSQPAFSDERYPQYRAATREFVVSLARDGASPGAIRGLLADMWARELDYCRVNRLVYRGPLLP
jgi:hypothetical protein